MRCDLMNCLQQVWVFFSLSRVANNGVQVISLKFIIFPNFPGYGKRSLSSFSPDRISPAGPLRVRGGEGNFLK